MSRLLIQCYCRKEATKIRWKPIKQIIKILTVGSLTILIFREIKIVKRVCNIFHYHNSYEPFVAYLHKLLIDKTWQLTAGWIDINCIEE